MDTYHETHEYKGFTIKIIQDTDSGSPRDWGNLGVMMCEHRRYDLGDEGATRAEYEALRDAGEIAISLPLYLYDHGGITMSTRPFSCPWDSGMVGVIYATKDALRCKRVTKKVIERATRVLLSEVEVYDQWLTGDVWGYIIEDEDEERLDSCWDFYGQDYCLEEAKRVVDCIIERTERESQEALRLAQEVLQLALERHAAQIKAWIRSRVPLVYRHSFVNPITD